MKHNLQILLLTAGILSAPLCALAQFAVPEAVITAAPLEGESPLPVSFDGSPSTGFIVNYEWMFGDGTTGSGPTAIHTFTAAGSYEVTLKVTDDTGATDQATFTVRVAAPSIPVVPMAAERDAAFVWTPNPEQVDGYKIY